MCGRASLFAPPWLVEERFDATMVDHFEPRYNIAPGDDLAVVTNEADDKIQGFEWGLVPEWVDDPADAPSPINARAESVADSGMFRRAFESRRCLVIVDGFYEWQDVGGTKQPYRVTRADNQPFAMAGLWARRESKRRARKRETVTVVTTEPNEVVRPLHDRMAVILEPDEEAVWLHEADPEERLALLDPCPPEMVRAYPVSTKVNDPDRDDPSVVRRTDPPRQTGLGDFASD